MKILIVDDEVELLDIYVDILADLDAQVTSYSDSRRALEDIALNEYDLVITDKKMPGVSGGEIINCIESKKDERTIIFLLTGDNTRTINFWHPKSKVIKKPIDSKSLIEEILNLNRNPN